MYGGCCFIHPFFVLLSPEIVIKNFKASFAGEPWFLKYSKVLDLIYQQTNELRVGKKENGESLSTFSVSVPRPGIEPGWVAPLVFETSASTDSAIWAIVASQLRVQR